MAKDGRDFEAEGWDWRYYADRAKRAKYDFDENELRPYLKLENVLDGLFYVANRLYGITIKPLPNVPLPDDKVVLANRDPKDNRIVLCFTLVDGTTRLFAYDVARFIHYRQIDETQPLRDRYAMSLDLDLVLQAPLIDEPDLPDVKPDSKGDGFDAEVQPWEDGGTIDVGV